MMLWFWRRKHPLENDLSAFLDDELDEARAREMRAHLEACPGCRTGLEELRAVRSMVSALPLPDAPRSFALSPEMAGRAERPLPQRRPLLLAPVASFAVLLAVLAFDFGGLSNGQSDDLTVGGQSSLALEATGSDPADAAAPVAAGEPELRATDDEGEGGEAGAGLAAVPPVESDGAADSGTSEESRATEPPPADVSTTQAGETEANDTDWLRLAQIISALVFAASLAVALWFRKEREGRRM